MTLITRQGKGSKLTIQEMDGNLEYLESLGFPYEGDAQILGSWQFETAGGIKSLASDEFEIDFSGVRFVGNGVGNTYEDTSKELSIYNLILDGNIDLVDPPVQFPLFGSIAGLDRGLDRLQISSRVIDQGEFGYGKIIQNAIESTFIIDGVFNGFVINQTKDISNDTALFGLNKQVGTVFSGVSFFTKDGIDNGFTIGTNISDEIKLFSVQDDEADEVFSVTQLQVVMEKVVNYDYLDDASAEAAGIPIGGIYHTSGTLKIRLT